MNANPFAPTPARAPGSPSKQRPKPRHLARPKRSFFYNVFANRKVPSSTTATTSFSETLSAFNRRVANRYLKEMPRWRLPVVFLLICGFLGVMAWAIWTWRSGYEETGVPGVYSVSPTQAWKNAVALVMLLIGAFVVTVLVIKGVLSLWAHWDAVVYESLREGDIEMEEEGGRGRRRL